MRNFYMPLLLLFLCLQPAFADKDVKTVKSYIKSGQNLDQAEKMVNKALLNDENKLEPDYYLLGYDVQKKVLDIENEKAYLKQNYDTARFFNSICKMYCILEKLDSVDALPDSKGRVKVQHRKRSFSALRPMRRNLLSGGLFYFKKSKYREAYPFFLHYVNGATLPLYTEGKYATSDTLITTAAYYGCSAAYSTGSYQDVLRLKDEALRDKNNGAQVQQLVVKSYQALGDSLNWVKSLKTGVREYPSEPYFFACLMDYFNRHQMYGEAVAFADSMLAVDSSAFHLYAKALVRFNMKQYDESIQLCQLSIMRDSTFADAYMTVGSSYCILAEQRRQSLTTDFKNAENKKILNEVRQYYRNALPYLTRYRALEPNDAKQWAPLLYNVYLNLNMGKEFDEIDKVISSQKL